MSIIANFQLREFSYCEENCFGRCFTHFQLKSADVSLVVGETSPETIDLRVRELPY